jgi:hypothetical protein
MEKKKERKDEEVGSVREERKIKGERRQFRCSTRNLLLCDPT